MNDYESIDKDLLSYICSFLKPFEEVIEQLSSDTKPTIYKVLPFKQYLLNQCKFHSDDHDGIQQIKIFLAELDFQSTNPKSLLSQCFDVPKNDLKLSITPYDELEEYMVLNVQLNENDHVLLFWLQHKLKFPTLFTMVRDFYAIPASNTIIERLFSSSKNTVTDKRTTLGAEKVNNSYEAASTETKRKMNFESSCSTPCDDQEQLATATVKKKPKVNKENDILCSEADRENGEIDCF
ncbi:unnamed protein product [Rotaria socialis]|uniref:HAT C-terminal dimerisation domain-containing protein n=2 Tax=Rotaria socialis TaxID=392032 RepID=A0A820L4L6_9BILA|nr:unnamed protein product [Rotaria socialis]CAF4527601.1 unnamed protein product [Rotaria socialis]